MLYRIVAAMTAFGAALLWTGCTSEQSSSPSGAASTPNPSMGQGGMVAVLPSRALSYLTDEYAFLYADVDQGVAHTLQSKNVAVVPAADVDAILNDSNGSILRRMKSATPGDLESAVVDLLWRLRDEQDVSMLIIPQVMVRSIVVRPPYQNVSWDGVQRDLTVHGGGQTGGPLQLDAASLNVGVYTAQGQPLYYGAGGIDLLENGVRAGDDVYTAPKQPGQIPMADIEQAAGIALSPWIREGGVRTASLEARHQDR
ncbi:MAG: hypothetical protein ACQKBV_03410 [Puniceicoccales bacterium]